MPWFVAALYAVVTSLQTIPRGTSRLAHLQATGDDYNAQPGVKFFARTAAWRVNYMVWLTTGQGLSLNADLTSARLRSLRTYVVQRDRILMVFCGISLKPKPVQLMKDSIISTRTVVVSANRACGGAG